MVIEVSEVRKPKRSVSVVITWVASYLIIIIVLAAAALAIYMESEKALDKQSRQFNEYVTATMARHVESIMLDIRRLYSNVMANPRVPDMARLRDVDLFFSNPDVRLFLEDMKTYNSYKNNVAFFYIYFKESNCVISEGGILDARYFFDIYFSGGGATYEAWLAKLGEDNLNAYYTEVLRRGDALLDVTAINMGFYRTPGVTISAVVNRDVFFRDMREISELSSSDAYVFNSRGDLILYSATQNMGGVPRRISDVPAAGNIVLTSEISFDSVSMTFVAVASRGDVKGHIIRMRLFSVSLIAACLALTFAMAWYFTKRSYRPVKELLGVFGISNSKNEYSSIIHSIEKIISKNNLLAGSVEKQNAALRVSMLSRLVKSAYEGEYTRDTFAKYGVNFQDGRFAVVSFYIEDINELFRDVPNLTPGRRFEDMQFIVANVFEEIFSTDDSAAYVSDADNMLFCIVNIFAAAACRDNAVPFILDKCNYCVRMINLHFNVALTYALSDLHNSVEDLPEAYSETLQTIEYKNMMNIARPMLYSDVKTKSKYVYHFTLEKEQKLINCVRTADYDSARKIVEDVFGQVQSDLSISPEYTKCLMFDVAASILKIPNEFHQMENDWFAGFEPDKILLYSGSVSAMKEHILSVLREICASMSIGKHKLNFQKEIIKYVHERYDNPNLNIDSIGAVFDMAPSYVSKIFKADYGETLVDFINKYRLEKAKELIATERYTLNEIAGMVGYSHIRTFNRVFKKYEGVPPSKYTV
jgi:AraC-like DNA-binding protein